MTIVIQNRFWDLKVGDDQFEVGLSFNQMPARLVIPFAAVTGFVDPAGGFAPQRAQIANIGSHRYNLRIRANPTPKERPA